MSTRGTASSSLTVEELLGDVPESTRAIAERLREIVKRTVPDVIERAYPVWRLIGYRVPDGKRSHYFGFIGPLPDRVTLGFQWGPLMSDPDGILLGAHLKQVRYLEFRSSREIDEETVMPMIVEAALIAADRGGRK